MKSNKTLNVSMEKIITKIIYSLIASIALKALAPVWIFCFQNTPEQSISIKRL